MPDYSIEIYAHDTDMCGGVTDSGVLVTLYGDLGSSEELALDRRLAVDGDGSGGDAASFRVQLAPLGEVRRLRIRQDGARLLGGWFLDRVVVTDESAGCGWTFPCGSLLARDQDGERSGRILDGVPLGPRRGC